jgi:hypothetical protein
MRARAAQARVAELIDIIRRQQTMCPTCGQPLATSRGVLFQGDKLVHAACWSDDPRPADQVRTAPGALAGELSGVARPCSVAIELHRCWGEEGVMAEQMILAIIAVALLAGGIVGDVLESRRGGGKPSGQDEDLDPNR